MNLTQKYVDGLAATKERQTYRDDAVTGFGVRVEPESIGGRRSFFWNAKIAGQVYFRSLGETSVISIKNARDAARELAGKAAKWKQAGCVESDNPFLKKEKPVSRAGAPTFAVLVERYIADHLHNPEAGIHHPDEAEKALRCALGKYFKTWLARPVDSFTTADVLALRDSAKPHTHMGNRLVEYARAMFSWGSNEDGKVNVWELPVNPAAKVKLAKEDPRERWLSPSELVQLETALDEKETPQDVADFVRIALDTSARKENILSAKWGDFDMDLRQWKILKSKGGAYTVDLLPRAVRIIERRKSERKSTSDYVFANANAPRGYVRIDKAFKALLKRIGGTLVDARIHDLRRTSGTYQARAGVPLQKIAGNLGHSDRNIESVLIYAKLAQADLPEARQAGADKMAEEMRAAKKRMAKQKQVPIIGRKSA